MDENNHFVVNEENGIVFALSNCMTTVDQIELVIHAVDRDGAEDGLTTSMEISVHKLTVDHLVVLQFYDTDYRNEHDIIEHVKNEVNVDFNVLRIVTLPEIVDKEDVMSKKVLLKQSRSVSEDETTTMAAEEETTVNGNSDGIFYKILVYAFDTSGRLQSSNEVLK